VPRRDSWIARCRGERAAHGVTWSAWHLLTSWRGSDDSADAVPLVIYLPIVLFSFLPSYRVLMGLVYRDTQSLFVAIPMHGVLVPCAFSVLAAPTIGWDLIACYTILAITVWIVVAVVFWPEQADRAEHPGRNARGEPRRRDCPRLDVTGTLRRGGHGRVEASRTGWNECG